MKESNASETKMTWFEQLKSGYKTPLGLFGVCLTTACFLLTLFGMIGHVTGVADNPYTPIITMFLFPTGMLVGLLIIPLAAYLQRKKGVKNKLVTKGFKIDFGNANHRKNIVLVVVLTVINLTVFSVAAYEGYHYMDSPQFCGLVCHQIMEPEYRVAQTSPHSNALCVDCHIAPGVGGLVKAKVSGLRQLKGVLVGDYQSPIPTPVHNLPPAKATCEKCHSPKAYTGLKTKKFVHYSNEDQSAPEEEIDLVLNVGGLNPVTKKQEGIHYHTMEGLKIEYLPLDEKRTKIGNVRVTRPDGEVVMYAYESEEEADESHGWVTMDCSDCHNRAAHIYDDLEEKVDFGLHTKQLNPEVEGLREDGLTLLQKEYASREQAEKSIEADLLAMMKDRHGEDFVRDNRNSLVKAAAYLREAYMRNIWPAIGITWGTYKSHLGHKYEDDGIGCFRCHDDEHESEDGEVITQDCSLCHEEP